MYEEYIRCMRICLCKSVAFLKRGRREKRYERGHLKFTNTAGTVAILDFLLPPNATSNPGISTVSAVVKKKKAPSSKMKNNLADLSLFKKNYSSCFPTQASGTWNGSSDESGLVPQSSSVTNTIKSPA